METELDENPIDIPPSTTTSTGSQKPKPKINVSKWDPENIDENIPQVKKKRKVLDLFRSPWDVLRNDWRALLAEFVATMMFVFMGTGLLVSYNKDRTEGGDLGAGLVSISLGFGIALSTMIYTVANISGGHLNPAVTIGLLLIRQIEIFKALGYVACQVGGGIVGTALMYGVMPDNVTELIHMGATSLGSRVTPGEGCAIEICLTFILVFTVCATAELSGDLKSMGRFAPLAIGYSVLVDHMIGVPFTGASMNPARSFGPALISGFWLNHWVYWVGPIIGGIFAAVVYHYLFILDDPPPSE
jgi:MIP family channel proteins